MRSIGIPICSSIKIWFANLVEQIIALRWGWGEEVHKLRRLQREERMHRWKQIAEDVGNSEPAPYGVCQDCDEPFTKEFRKECPGAVRCDPCTLKAIEYVCEAFGDRE